MDKQQHGRSGDSASQQDRSGRGAINPYITLQIPRELGAPMRELLTNALPDAPKPLRIVLDEQLQSWPSEDTSQR